MKEMKNSMAMGHRVYLLIIGFVIPIVTTMIRDKTSQTSEAKTSMKSGVASLFSGFEF